MGFASAVYAASFCCGDGKTKDECCAERGKIYCPSDETCRTRCPDVTEPDCIGGCINPEGECCTWCPSAEVCQRMGKCQKIVDGCYDCVTCPVPNPCPVPQCMNGDGVCCDSCPRTCPAGQCLVSVDGCYQCGECGDDDDDTETTEPNLCEGKDEYKDCKKCDEKTGEYTIGGCQDPNPECCNNECYEKCAGDKVRNTETCICECPAGMYFIPETGECCSGRLICGSKCCKEDETCAADNGGGSVNPDGYGICCKNGEVFRPEIKKCCDVMVSV